MPAGNGSQRRETINWYNLDQSLKLIHQQTLLWDKLEPELTSDSKWMRIPIKVLSILMIKCICYILSGLMRNVYGTADADNILVKF